MKSFWRIFKRNKSYTAIDIGVSEIKLAGVKVRGGVTRISALGRHKTPEGAFSENPPAGLLSQALKELLESSEVKCDEVITAIGGKNVLTRHIRLPKMPSGDLDKAIVWEAEKYLPLAVKDLVVRYAVLDEVAVDGHRQYHILLAAASRDFVYNYLEIFARAHLDVRAIDIRPLALGRVFSSNSYGATKGGAVAVADLGEKTTNIVILKKSRVRYTRSLPLGGVSPSPDGLRELGRQIKKALDFYETQENGSAVEKIIATGGAINIDGLGACLAKVLGLPVDTGYPDLPVLEGSGLALPVDPAFSVAVGLAMREAPYG